MLSLSPSIEVVKVVAPVESHAAPQVDLGITKDNKMEDTESTPSPSKKVRKPLDNKSRALFNLSILFAAAAIIVFIFAIPCPPASDRRIWSTSIHNYSIDSPIQLLLTNQSQDYVILMTASLNHTSILSDQGPHQQLLALNSSNGHQLWKLDLNGSVTLLFCPEGHLPPTDRGYPFDCLIATSTGDILAIETSSLTVLWNRRIHDVSHADYCNSAAIIPDVDQDSFQDIMLACNTYENSMLSRYWLFLSATMGSVINRSVAVKDEQFIADSLIIDHRYNNQAVIYFSVFLRNMSSRVSYMNVRDLSRIHTATGSNDMSTQFLIQGGMMKWPSILVDLDGDGQKDIITTFTNGTIIATLGATMARYWVVHLRHSSIVNLPAPGDFNNDIYPDIMINFKVINQDLNDYVIINGYNGKILSAGGDETQSQLNYMPSNIISVATSNESSDVFIYPVMFSGNTSCKAYSDNSTCSQALLLGAHNLQNNSHSPLLLDTVLPPQGDVIEMQYSSTAAGFDKITNHFWIISTMSWKVSNGMMDSYVLSISKSSLDGNFKCVTSDSNFVVPSCSVSLQVNFLNVTSQPWLSYMGTAGNGIYTPY
ncbi:Protein FAM234B [Trichoplax sp. H2]|nr:Protein FAM234B [Trichoplax sp. H2]|eukprot:RDD39991.1 Protein FAM234B [Trichoplax sp. H2]